MLIALIQDIWNKLYKKVANVDVLYHESTYTNEYKDRAKSYYHSTAEEAATVAKRLM